MEQFRHTELKDPARQIRLIPLRSIAAGPADQVTSIKLNIRVCDIKNAPNYQAISYTWGSLDRLANVRIDGKVLAVTTNCVDALRQVHSFTRYSKSRHLWIDAICIDQQNLDERSKQVTIMGTIFQQAQSVYIVLASTIASPPPIFTEVMPGPNSLYPDLRRFSYPLPGAALADAVKWLASISEDPYWKRVWTLQEFVLAEALQVMCGRSQIPWRQLFTFLEAVVKKYGTLEKHYLQSNKWAPEDCTIFNIGPQLSASPMIRFSELRMNNRKHAGKPSDGYSYVRPHYFRTRDVNVDPPLVAVLRHSMNSKCSDPRDRIYGVFSLISWPIGSAPLTADYSMTLIQVCAAAIRSALDFARRDMRENLACYVAHLCATIADTLGIPTNTMHLWDVLHHRSMTEENLPEGDRCIDMAGSKGTVKFARARPWMINGRRYRYNSSDPREDLVSWSEETYKSSDLLIQCHDNLPPVVLAKTDTELYRLVGFVSSYDIGHPASQKSAAEQLAYALPRQNRCTVICNSEDFLIWMSVISSDSWSDTHGNGSDTYRKVMNLRGHEPCMLVVLD